MSVIVAIGEGETPEIALRELEKELQEELTYREDESIVSLDRSLYEIRSEKDNRDWRKCFYSDISFDDAISKANNENPNFIPVYYSVGKNYTLK